MSLSLTLKNQCSTYYPVHKYYVNREIDMAVVAITPDYIGERKDRRENFANNILVFIGWDEHLLFCSAKAFTVDPKMKFKEFKENILRDGFSQHPDYEMINWKEVVWKLNDTLVSPEDDQTLEDIGFDHKSLLRFKTPGLNGWKGTGV